MKASGEIKKGFLAKELSQQAYDAPFAEAAVSMTLAKSARAVCLVSSLRAAY